MQENDSIKAGTSQSTEHSDAKPEKIVKKARTRERKTSAKKQTLLPPGQFRNILAAAIILCLGLIGVIIFMLARDTTPPVIQKVSLSDMTEASAIITWQTEKPATSQVKTCESNTCVSTELDGTLVSNHSVTLTDLKPNTKYQFTVISKDKHKNEARLDIELTTPVQPYAIPLVISGVRISNITDLSATITWQTDRPATSQVEYGETDFYGLIASDDKELTTNHSITLTGLKPKISYNFGVKSKDAGGNEAISEARTFVTISTAAAATEVGPEIGKRAPDFTLPTLDGKEASLSQFQGKKVILHFWETSCSACESETPHIQAIFDGWSHDDLEIVAVSVGERAAFVQSFMDRRTLTFPVLLDSDGAVSNIYQVSTFPTTFFINADGIISQIKRGAFMSQFEIEAILKLL